MELPHPFPSPHTNRVLVSFLTCGDLSSTIALSGMEQSTMARWRTEPELWEKLKPLAREMRRKPTEAEEILWQHLRRSQLCFRFRRQHAIERFVVDFYCAQAGLIVEVDGPIHQYRKEEDLIRQGYIESLGMRMLRFSNNEVCQALSGVLSQITVALTSPPNPLSASGEGDRLSAIQDFGRRG